MKLNQLVRTKDMSHEEWLDWRKKGIGGSDAGAICGMNPYTSPIKVFIEKTEHCTNESLENEAMRQGNDLEQYVAERFCEATGLKVKRNHFILYKEEHPFMFANVDRLVIGEEAGLECKTASPYTRGNWEDGKIPEWYEIQCHHYMAVTGAKAWYIAVCILGTEFKWKKIERDEGIIEDLIQIEERFWTQHVLKKEMPAPDGSEASEEFIKKYYKDSTIDKAIELHDFDEKLNRRNDLEELIKKLETERNQIDQEVKQSMKDAELAYGKEYRVTWKNVFSNRVDTKRLKTEQPEIYRQYINESASRRFTIKKIAI